MKYCPLCGHEVGVYHEVTQKEPYIHTNPFDGIHIYGAFSAPKETICHGFNFLHFAFYDAKNELVDHRLVKLGVENPTTKTATDEFWEGYNSEDSEDDEDWQDENNEWSEEQDEDYDSWCEDNSPNDSRNL